MIFIGAYFLIGLVAFISAIIFNKKQRADLTDNWYVVIAIWPLLAVFYLAILYGAVKDNISHRFEKPTPTNIVRELMCVQLIRHPEKWEGTTWKHKGMKVYTSNDKYYNSCWAVEVNGDNIPLSPRLSKMIVKSRDLKLNFEANKEKADKERRMIEYLESFNA